MTDPRFATAFARIVALIAAGVLVAVGLAWLRDRTTERDAPRWETAQFVALHEPGPPASPAARTWVMAVNLGCPHCRESLPAVRTVAARETPPVRLAVLLVDTPAQPAESEVESLGVEEVWWDARQLWRERWGHRVYGEVLVFDRDGRHVGTMPPSR